MFKEKKYKVLRFKKKDAEKFGVKKRDISFAEYFGKKRIAGAKVKL